MAPDGGTAQAVLEQFQHAGVDTQALAMQLQREGTDAFTKSWQALLARLADKSAALARPA
jgi:transaldolase